MPKTKLGTVAVDIDTLRQVMREEISQSEKRVEKRIIITEERIINEIASAIADGVLPVQENHEKRLQVVEAKLHVATL